MSGAKWLYCILSVLMLTSAASAAEECVLEKKYTLKQRRKRAVKLKKGDKVTIVKEGKKTITVKAKGKTRVVPKSGFLSACKVAAAEAEVAAEPSVAPRVGVMPFSMSRAKRADKALLGAWSGQLHEALLATRADVQHLKKNNAERVLAYPKKDAAKLKLFKERAPEGVGFVVSGEVTKKRRTYTVRTFVTSLATGEVVATSQSTLKKGAKADWANTVVAEIAPSLPPTAEAEAQAAEEAARVEAEANAAAAAAESEKVAAAEASASTAEAEAEADEGGSAVPTVLYASGGILAAIAAGGAVAAAITGTVALLDAMTIMSGVLPAVFAPESKVQRSTYMSYATDGLWGAAAVFGVTGIALILGGVIASVLLSDDEAPADEGAPTALERGPIGSPLALE